MNHNPLAEIIETTKVAWRNTQKPQLESVVNELRLTASRKNLKICDNELSTLTRAVISEQWIRDAGPELQDVRVEHIKNLSPGFLIALAVYAEDDLNIPGMLQYSSKEQEIFQRRQQLVANNRLN